MNNINIRDGFGRIGEKEEVIGEKYCNINKIINFGGSKWVAI